MSRKKIEVEDRIFWQAHRGAGTTDAPDNTMAAFRYTWSLGGIPEADIHTTKDGVAVYFLNSDAPMPLLRTWADELDVDMGEFDACLAEDRRLNRVASAANSPPLVSPPVKRDMS